METIDDKEFWDTVNYVMLFDPSFAQELIDMCKIENNDN